MNLKTLFARVIQAQEKHITFLDATQKNLAYFLFGKNIDLVKKYTIPKIDILGVVNSFTPAPDNPLHHIVASFTDEIAASEFRTTVKPHPVQGKEPYESYGEMLETQLARVHQLSKRRLYLKPMVFELLAHGYFGLYFDGFRYYYLTAYDLFPGDQNIHDIQDQQFIVRKTSVNKMTLQVAGIDPTQESPEPAEYSHLDDLEMFTLYDVYVKTHDLNVAFTQKGTVVYQQPFRYPKRFPIAVANTSELMTSFYSVPIISQLIQKLIDYQKARTSIKESSSSIAKPILTYDSDSGIDVNKLHAALKMGYKHVIVGKNREGDINFKQPGHLPTYAQQLPDNIEEDIMKFLGLNKTFMGMPNVGARERGALARLLKTSFRKLASISGLVEECFSDMDKYIIDFWNDHRITTSRRTGLNLEEIFSCTSGHNVEYVPSERFRAYSSEDSLEKKAFVLNKWKAKMIPTEAALEQMGEDQPRKLIKQMKNQMMDDQEFSIELGQKARTKISKSLFDEVSERLNGQLNWRYYLTPVSDGKLMVKVHIAEAKLTSFLLSDFSDKVMIDAYADDVAPSAEQITPETAPELPPAPPEVPAEPTAAAAEPVPSEPERRGRPAPVPPVEEPVKKGEAPEASIPTVPGEEEPAPAPVGEGFSESKIEAYVAKSKPIYNSQKYFDLPGMYIVEPHAKWVYLGRKLALVLGQEAPNQLNKPMLFCGKQVYGVIILREIVSQFDFKATQRYHMVSDKDKAKWWGSKPVFLYMFEFYPFKFAVDYNRKPGVTTFFGDVEIAEQPEPPSKMPTLKGADVVTTETSEEEGHKHTATFYRNSGNGRTSTDKDHFHLIKEFKIQEYHNHTHDLNYE
jgi:hypothetical protein